MSQDQNANGELEEQRDFESLLLDLSVRFVNVSAERLDQEINDALRHICQCLNLDLGTLWEQSPDESHVLLMTHVYRPLGGAPIPERLDASVYFPWNAAENQARKTVVVSSLENLSEETVSCDLASWRYFDIKSLISIPLSSGGNTPFGVIGFCTTTAERSWPEPLQRRLETLAQIFANALARRRADEALRESEERLSLATDAADIGLWELDSKQTCFWVNDKARALFGLTPGNRLDLESFLAMVHPDDRQLVREVIRRTADEEELASCEYRLVLPDGQVRWMLSRGRMHARRGSVKFMGSTSDITARKRAEDLLKQTLDEVQKLREQLQKENVYLREQIRSASGHSTILGESEPIQRMLAMARKVAPTDSAVLITGETGTGKELLAQAIHDMSSRKNRTMVKVNCAALPAALIESELFGREKGAYTGAMTQQVGRFELASKSTIFLDEIGELPLEIQVKLLRVLQDGRFERLGGATTIATDIRVIAATNRDLGAMVHAGSFREDLFHRLNVFPIEAPPLRSRIGDIPLLVWKVVQEFNMKMGRSVDSIPKATMESLQHYPWPGNVRELRNVIERAMILSDGRSLSVDFPAGGKSAVPTPVTLAEAERVHVLAALERTHWRISGKGGAAEALGLLPTTLHSLMKRLGISRPTA